MTTEAAVEQTDINTAKLLAQWANGWPELNPNRAYDRLFQTTGGQYFLARQPPGKRHVDILALTLEEARQWAQDHCDEATTKRLFG